MAKLYNQEINKHQDWGGDESTDNLPVAGNRVQEFIKKQLDGKAGEFYYDTANNRYIVFADADTRDEYLENPTKTELILGSFDAPFNYTAEIILSTPTYNSILSGQKNNYIDFTFDTKNKSGQSIGEDIICTYTFIRNGVKKTVTERYRYGAAVHFNVDGYIDNGTNNITIGIVGQTTLAATTVGITYHVIDLMINSSYNISTHYNLIENPSATAAVPYSISGYGTKIMEWYLDGRKLEYVKVEDEVVEVSTTRTKYISLANLNQGKHSLQFRAYTMIDGEKFYSNIIYHDFIVYTDANTNPIIAVSAVFPVGTDILTSGNLQMYGIMQYIPHDINFAVFNPLSSAQIETKILIAGKVDATVITHNNEVSTYSLRPLDYGVQSMIIRAGATDYVIGLNIEKSSTSLEPIVNGLVLDLQAIGKTNSDANKDEWTYGKYYTQFTKFTWNMASGWVDNRLLISNGASITVNYAPFTPDPTIGGRTLEFEFATKNVQNDETVICYMTDEAGTGLKITASEIILKSAGGSTVSTRFKSNENIRVSIVINPKSGTTNRLLALIYVDGICSGAVNYSPTDSFLNTAQITFRSTVNEADVALKSIRAYNAVLSSDQILNNYILYRDTPEELLSIYDKNNIYEAGTTVFSLDALAAQCPVLKITGDIPTLENSTDKNTTIYVDAEYVNLQDPTRSFTTKGMRMRPQGTSSMGYPKKNYRIYTKYGTMRDYMGNVVPEGLYSFKDNAQPVNCWCFKADYAESSGTHNTGVARLWNKAMYDAQINGSYLLRTQAQKAAVEQKYPYDVRTCVDGFPCHLVYRLNDNSDWIYIGKYNFNNDKSTESVFGFRDIPGFDNSKMQCFELLNNGNHLALFEDMDNFDNEWDQAYESRYPDGSTDVSDLKSFSQWVVSTKGNVEKFKSEKWGHLDVYKVAAYYIYLMRFGSVDQVVKNAMLTSEDGVHWYFINYDNDTINGVRNDGLLAYNYEIDRQTIDHTFEALVYAYAGHESTLWNNLEADAEFMRIVSEVDNALYMAGLSYKNVIDMFDNQQSGKWGERVYNQDAQYKYISPFTNEGTNNLFMLQGARRAHRRWWISHRFDLLDSKFVSGAYKSKSLEFKAANAPAGLHFSITAGNRLYYGYGINNVPVETGIMMDAHTKHTFESKQVINVGDPVRVYSAVNLEELDVHEFIEYLSTINIGEVNDELVGTRFKKLIMGFDTTVGVPAKLNTSLYEISGLAQATMLEYLNIVGYRGITSLDLSNHFFLKTLKAYRSGLTGVSLANGGLIEKLELPETMQVFSFENLNYLTTNNFSITGNWENISWISVKNCPNLQIFPALVNWYTHKTTVDSGCTLVLEGINWTNVNPADLISIGGIKSAGGTLRITGTIHLSTVTQDQVNQLSEIFGNNCFNKDNELFIDAPDGVFISGPSEVLEGKSYQYTAAVFSQSTGEVVYTIIANDVEGKTVDGVSITDDGVLRSELKGTVRNIQVRVKFIPTQGNLVIATSDVVVRERYYPDETSMIEGQRQISTAGDYTFTFHPACKKGEINGEYTIAWALLGSDAEEAPANVTIKMYDDTGCVIEVDSITDITEFFIECMVVRADGKSQSIDTPCALVIEGIIATASTCPKLLAKMYKLKYCANTRYMTRDEARAVTDYFSMQEIDAPDEDFTWFKEFLNVSRITENGFYNCSFAKLEFPPALSSIGNYGLRNLVLTNQDTLTLPETCTTLDSGSLAVATAENNKLKTIIFPKKVTSLGNTLLGNSSPIRRIKFPEVWDSTMTSAQPFIDLTLDEIIGGTLFSKSYYCDGMFRNLKYSGELSIPEGVNEIGNGCFEKAVLGSVRFPDSLQTLKTSFTNATVNTLYVPSFKANVGTSRHLYNCRQSFYNMKIGQVIYPADYAWDYNSFLFSSSVIDEVVVGNDMYVVNNRNNDANYDGDLYNATIKTVRIHDGDTTQKIVDGVLYNASGDTLKLYINTVQGMQSPFVIPDTCKHIYPYACNNNNNSSIGIPTENRRKIELHSGILTIGSRAFYRCNITQLNLPNLTALGGSAFSYCKELSQVTLPPSSQCFYGDQDHFSYCTKLSTVRNLPKVLPSYMFRGCTELVDVDLSEVTEINHSVFSETGLRSVELNSVSLFGNDSFRKCPNLANVIINNQKRGIAADVFAECPNLVSVEFRGVPVDLSYNWGARVFSGCTKLQVIKMYYSPAPTIGTDCFGNSNETYTGKLSGTNNVLYVPAGAIGYDTGAWADPLQNPEKCNFTISLTL